MLSHVAFSFLVFSDFSHPTDQFFCGFSISKHHQSTDPDGGPFGGCSGTSKTMGKHESPYGNRRFRVSGGAGTRGTGGASPPRTNIGNTNFAAEARAKLVGAPKRAEAAKHPHVACRLLPKHGGTCPSGVRPTAWCFLDTRAAMEPLYCRFCNFLSRELHMKASCHHAVQPHHLAVPTGGPHAPN